MGGRKKFLRFKFMNELKYVVYCIIEIWLNAVEYLFTCKADEQIGKAFD